MGRELSLHSQNLGPFKSGIARALGQWMSITFPEWLLSPLGCCQSQLQGSQQGAPVSPALALTGPLSSLALSAHLSSHHP